MSAQDDGMARRGKRVALWCVGVAVVSVPILRATLAQELERQFCDDTDPVNDCPGQDCVCVDDTLEVVFEGQLESSVFEYSEITPNMLVRSRVLLDVTTDCGLFSSATAFRIVPRSGIRMWL